MDEKKEGSKKFSKHFDKKLIAKKDHVIVHNDYRCEIKKGDEVKVPKVYEASLKSEGVI